MLGVKSNYRRIRGQRVWWLHNRTFGLLLLLSKPPEGLLRLFYTHLLLLYRKLGLDDAVFVQNSGEIWRSEIFWKKTKNLFAAYIGLCRFVSTNICPLHCRKVHKIIRYYWFLVSLSIEVFALRRTKEISMNHMCHGRKRIWLEEQGGLYVLSAKVAPTHKQTCMLRSNDGNWH